MVVSQVHQLKAFKMWDSSFRKCP